MNLTKIGAYIASKRKALGMTQMDLAKRLGMSDKSVSKWERGICLPDVSVYIQLCEILGISINEFIAGEDLDAEQLPKQAEENIIVVAEAGDRKRKKLQRILIALSAIYLCIASFMMMQENVRFRNHIDPVPPHSEEMVLMDALFDEGTYVYRYDLDNSFSSVAVNLTCYQNGKITEKRTIASYEQSDLRTAGMIAILPDHGEAIKVIITEGDGKVSAEVPMLKNVTNPTHLESSVSKMSSSKDVKKGDEVGLVCFTYSKEDPVPVSVDDVTRVKTAKENDYMYLLTAEFQ